MEGKGQTNPGSALPGCAKASTWHHQAVGRREASSAREPAQPCLWATPAGFHHCQVGPCGLSGTSPGRLALLMPPRSLSHTAANDPSYLHCEGLPRTVPPTAPGKGSRHEVRGQRNKGKKKQQSNVPGRTGKRKQGIKLGTQCFPPTGRLSPHWGPTGFQQRPQTVGAVLPGGQPEHLHSPTPTHKGVMSPGALSAR